MEKQEDMKSRRPITYLEYRRHCLLNGVKPERRRVMGPFVNAEAILEKKGSRAADPAVGEVFSMLQEGGYLSRKKISEAARKMHLDENALSGIFEVCGEDISEEQFTSLFAGCTGCKEP
ncbi:uncharacterized protein VICG_01600 [Vittaforma corneae ATCC 50505]|uniref:Uncharacterized protein n=1 Tax=Vittaforma corneae (strain ATCC 50505) TaxID=993615 RepID=L2GL43_VITCO|nr:uncharacterized protein VICG_01600 [Vittaforma corneae ATCC 50505]ELA41359.1 hypothetical protein VICG_01600 [Vittaforma corneae ATCC 50505]